MERIALLFWFFGVSALAGTLKDTKVTQLANVSPPSWQDVIISPAANSVLGFDGNKTASNITIGSGLSLASGVLSSSDAGNAITALTGDGTAAGPGSAVFTLVSVISASSVGSSTAIPVLTYDAKGRLTATSTAAVVAPAGTLTGTTLASNVVSSSLTSVGTIVTGTWQGTVLAGQYGGSGVANTGTTFTRGGNVTFSGAFGFTGTLTGTTSVTYPTSGVLATVAGSVPSVAGTAGNVLVNGATAAVSGSAVTLSLPTALTSVNSITTVSGQPFTVTSDTATLHASALNAFNVAAGVTPFSELEVDSTSTSSPRGIMSAQFNTGTDGARFHFRKARGTRASPTTVVTGDNLGRLVGTGYDGTSYLEMASIYFASEGTIATNRVPTNIQFWTATDASPSVMTLAGAFDSAQKLTLQGALSAVGHTTFEGITSTGATGTGKLVYSITPTLTGSPVVGGVTFNTSAATSLNSVTSAALSNLTLGTGTFGTALTFTSATGAATFASSVILPDNGSAGVTGLALVNNTSIGQYSLHVANSTQSAFRPIRIATAADTGTHRPFEVGFYTGNDPTSTWNRTVYCTPVSGHFQLGFYDATLNASWGTIGALFNVNGASTTDGYNSGAVSAAVFSAFQRPTVLASSVITVADAATVYIAGGPQAGANATLTNSWGLWNVGGERIDGVLKVTNSSASTLTTNGSGIFGGGVGIAGALNVGSSGSFAGSVSVTGAGHVLSQGPGFTNSTAYGLNVNSTNASDQTNLNPGVYVFNNGTSSVYGMDLGYKSGYRTRFLTAGKFAWAFTGTTPSAQSDYSEIATLDTSGNYAITGNLTVSGTGGVTALGGTTPMHTSSTTFTSGAGASLGTLTNAPAAGNPTSWIKIVDNGVTRYIPAW